MAVVSTRSCAEDSHAIWRPQLGTKHYEANQLANLQHLIRQLDYLQATRAPKRRHRMRYNILAQILAHVLAASGIPTAEAWRAWSLRIPMF